MIRIVLLGRTGNNLFQYALGRVLARKHGVPLVMDASWFNADGWAEVSHFLRLPLKARVVRPLSLGSRALRNLTGKHYWEFLACPFLRESSTDQSFDPRFLAAPADCVLFGYFQTPLYFNSMADELRDELNGLLAAGVNLDETIRCKLAAPGSVAVHIRRGDYLSIPEFQVCDMAYYDKSMESMRAENPSARFFVFSDDPAWCREVFNAPDVEVMDFHRNPLHDLHAMSLASHHIIANSSYSWWAAWIGKKQGQRVVMPDRWKTGDNPAPIAEKKWQR